jgi:DNA-binding CsgD family transcriptional regulator
MVSNEQLSELLATLYAAPLEPEKWQVFFDRLCDLTNISCGYLVASNPNEGNLVLAGGGLNFDPEVFHLYNEHYGANDPYREPLLSNPRIGLIQGEELVSHAELVKSELYNEVLSRYDLEYMSMLSCNCSSDRAELLSLWRSPKHGPLDTASIRLLQTLVPHVQTAIRLRAKVVASNTSNLFSEMALDAMSIAAFLVTLTGRVRHMNRLAEAQLQRADGLKLDNGKLTATNLHEIAQMESLISGAVAKGKNRSDDMPGGAMKISRSGSQLALQITVIPAPDTPGAVKSSSCALVLVHDPSSLPKSRAAFMRHLYALTPTESRLADLLLGGLEVRDIAHRLTMTLETARFHLKRVLTKTGTRRQTELMRLMLSLPGQ